MWINLNDSSYVFEDGKMVSKVFILGKKKKKRWEWPPQYMDLEQYHKLPTEGLVILHECSHSNLAPSSDLSF